MTARRLLCAAAIALLAAAQPSALRPEPSALRPEPSALRPEPSALRPEPSALRPEPSALSPLISIDVHVTANGAPVDDLAAGDFSIVEDKAPRSIERFTHVVAGEAHPRAFVVFLDASHLMVDDRHPLFQPLVAALDRVIGPGDLVAIMTPMLRFKDVTFSPKGASVRAVLEKYWPWGGPDRVGAIKDPLEDLYRTCYPPSKDGQVAVDLIERSREKTTFAAFERLAEGLRASREPRTAVLAISNGWTLVKPNGALARPIVTGNRPRTTPGNFVPGGRQADQGAPASKREPTPCDPDRLDLAQFDGAATFDRTIDEANAAGLSFYPVAGDALVADRPAKRNAREIESLQTIARGTDGVSAVTGAELDAVAARVASDLRSYYVISFRSPVAVDGRVHGVDVTVDRPGAEVRTRRGYLVPTDVAVAETTDGGEARVTRDDMDEALEPLEEFARDAPFRLDLSSGWLSSGAAAFWVVGEVGGANAGDWLGGADGDLTLTDASGAAVASTHLEVDPGSHSFRAVLTPGVRPAPGTFDLHVAIESPGASKPIDARARVVLSRAPLGRGIVIYRSGPTTANKYLPTADRRFRRSDRVRIEAPAGSAGAATARLLDRVGAPKPVPVAASVRTDADGSRWLVAELALVPLAPGDYVIEMKDGAGARVLVPFRMIP